MTKKGSRLAPFFVLLTFPGLLPVIAPVGSGRSTLIKAEKMSQHISPVVECQMMIRRPQHEVFQAFVDPEITTRFWFTKSSGMLETGKSVTWEWEMYGVKSTVLVKEIVPHERITIEWNTPPTIVDFEFSEVGEGKTYVIIKNYGFHQSGDELIEAVKDNTGGFTTVLDGLKAYLEHGLELNLIADKFPGQM